MDDKISIIIPVYKVENYIARCLDSLISQTYSNLEIICIDDGSPDKSGDILDKYAEKDCRIVVVHKNNEGVSAARNDGLKIATGDYIGFVDSDDYVNKSMFERLINLLKRESVDIATCSYIFDYAGELVYVKNKNKVPTTKTSIEDFLKYIYLRDEYKAVAGYLWTRLFKRSLLKNEDGSLRVAFKEEYGGSDDIPFIADIHINAQSIAYLDEPLYYYFQRNNSIVHDDDTQIISLSWPRAYEYVIDLFLKNNISQDIIDVIIRMYVYRCGKLLESAIKKREKYGIQITLLKEKIEENLKVYKLLNDEYPDRINWLENLLFEEDE